MGGVCSRKRGSPEQGSGEGEFQAKFGARQGDGFPGVGGSLARLGDARG